MVGLGQHRMRGNGLGGLELWEIGIDFGVADYLRDLISVSFSLD